MDGRERAKGMRLYCYLATLLPESSTVDDNLKKSIQACFMSLLYNKAKLYDFEHSSTLHGTGVLFSTRLGEECSSDRAEKKERHGD